MKRDLFNDLEEWRHSPLRKPVILRGARQVGKSWLIKEFGRQFARFIQLNFEKDAKAAELFSGNLHAKELTETISLYTQKKIIPGETLLFLDEIQECERAITALRYFKEELPDLHVVAAGSLVDFAIDKVGIPVGRVQFMYLHPLSFGEFLTANDQDELRQHIHAMDVHSPIHEKILGLLKTYLWLGGMPAVVEAWLNHKVASVCQELQDDIIEAYKQDFHQYARDRQIEHVTKVFESVSVQLGRKFKFSHVDEALRAASLREALHLLEKAGIVHVCYHSSGQNQPLGAEINFKKIKVYLFDIGLAQRMLGLNLSRWIIGPVTLKTLGQIAEQFVAQEFIAYTNIKRKEKLYYWHREARSSNAEVDFLVIKNGIIVPVEVKSGKTGALKSMCSFLQTHLNSLYGLKISESLFGQNGKLVEIPLYGIEAWLKSAS